MNIRNNKLTKEVKSVLNIANVLKDKRTDSKTDAGGLNK